MSLAEEGKDLPSREKNLPSREKNLPSPLNPDREDLGDFDFHMIKAMQALEKKVERNSKLIRAQTKYLYNKVERKQIEAPRYYTVETWAAMHVDEFGHLTSGELISMGREATKLSKEYCYDIKYEKRESNMSIGLYHIDILNKL